MEIEQEIHKTHKKDDGGVERNLLGSLEELGVTGVWNHSSEAIQGVTGCSLVTVAFALVIHAAAHKHREKAEGIQSSPKEEHCASR